MQDMQIIKGKKRGFLSEQDTKKKIKKNEKENLIYFRVRLN